MEVIMGGRKYLPGDLKPAEAKVQARAYAEMLGDDKVYLYREDREAVALDGEATIYWVIEARGDG